MLSIGDAHRLIDTHLGNSARAVHSQFVGRLMRRLAERTGGDPLLWELVGLCHDLDYEVTAGDWSRHGLVAAEWLANDLPSEGLDAIKAHDHRAGVISSLPISHALKLADALAIAHDHLGPDLVPLLAHRPDELAPRLADRPHLPAMIVANSAAIELPLPALASIMTQASVVDGSIR